MDEQGGISMTSLTMHNKAGESKIKLPRSKGGFRRLSRRYAYTRFLQDIQHLNGSNISRRVAEAEWKKLVREKFSFLKNEGMTQEQRDAKLQEVLGQVSILTRASQLPTRLLTKNR